MKNIVIGILGFMCGGSLVFAFYTAFLSRGFSPVFPKFSIARTKLSQDQLLLLSFIVLGLFTICFNDALLGCLFLFFGVAYWYLKIKGPMLWMNYQKERILNQMRDIFPQALGMFIQALKTGQTVPQVLEYLSNELPQPLRQEFSKVCAEMSLGLSAEAALDKMAERYPGFAEFGQFLESYKISRQTGANLTRLLQVLLDGMEEKNRLLRKMNAMTSQARLSGLVMGLLPVLLGSIFFVMDPSLMAPLVTTPGGWGILCAAAVLESIGFLWIRQLLRLEI